MHGPALVQRLFGCVKRHVWASVVSSPDVLVQGKAVVGQIPRYTHRSLAVAVVTTVVLGRS